MRSDTQVIITFKEYEELLLLKAVNNPTWWIKLHVTPNGSGGHYLEIRKVGDEKTSKLAVATLIDSQVQMLKGYKICIFKDEETTKQ